MPPHIQSPVDSEHDDDHIKLSDHFWSCDLKGMNQLMDHIINTYDELNQLHNIYVKRAELEHAFGQQLETLAEDSSTQENDKGVTGAIHVVQQELVKAAQSHLDFSKRLQQNVAVEMKRWVEDHQDELKKIKTSLETLYDERQDIIGQLYHVREAYQTLDKQSPKRQTLQNDYRLLLNKTDGILKQWNTDWKQACDQVEQMEQDRVDFFTANVWDYANLASARLMVQDEWCEAIRTQLETCSFEYERDQCIQQAGVGKLVPTTSDYVTHFFSQQKGHQPQQQPRSKVVSTEHINKSLPSKPQPPQESTISDKSPPQQQENTVSPSIKPLQQENIVPPPSIKRKPVDQTSFKDKKVSAPMALEELLKKFENKADSGRRQQQQRSRDTYSGSLSRQPPPPSSPPTTRSTRNNHHNNTMDQPDKNGYKDKRASQQRQPDKAEEVSPCKPNAHDHSVNSSQSTSTTSSSSSSSSSSQRETMSPVQPPPPTTDRNHQTTLGHPTPIMPPKSPRPQSQQIMSPPGDRPMNFPPPINTSPNYNYSQPPKSPLQHYAPPVSPNMVQHQPAASPMLYPSNPPVNNFQHQAPSPMIPFQQPASPMVMNHQQMSYSPHPQHQSYHHQPPRSPNMVASSPAWPTLSRPTSPYMPSRPSSPLMQRPTMLPDGTEILFWCQAMYDYTAQDPVELSFPAHSLFAVVYVALDGWWDACAFDGHHFIGSSGSIPSNYMRRL